PSNGSQPRRPLPSTGFPRSEFPGFSGTMRRSDVPPPLSPHFVSFVWRYHLVRLFSVPSWSDADQRAWGRSGAASPTYAAFYRDGDDGTSQVPGEPSGAYALFFDPGRTASLRPYKTAARPPRWVNTRAPNDSSISGLYPRASALAV